LANSNEDNKEPILTLTELGLTTTQARVYLTLAKTNALTAKTLATLSEVCRPDVYRILNQLQKTGLVEKIIAKPEEFQALPIDKGLSILLQRRIQKTQDLQYRAIKLVQTIKKRDENPATVNQISQFVLIPTLETANSRAERLLNTVEKNICLLGLTKKTNSWLSQYALNLEVALNRGVKCRIIMPKPNNGELGDSYKFLSKNPNFELGLISDIPKATFAIWDEKEILITTSIIDAPNPIATLWSNNKCLIDLHLDYFEYLWLKTKIQNSPN